MTAQELKHQGGNLLASILQDVVTRIRERVDFRFRQPSPPFRQESGVEHKIALTPADERWQPAKLAEVFFNFRNKLVAGVTRGQRNIADELMDCYTVFPGIVRLKETGADAGLQWPNAAITRCS